MKTRGRCKFQNANFRNKLTAYVQRLSMALYVREMSDAFLLRRSPTSLSCCMSIIRGRKIILHASKFLNVHQFRSLHSHIAQAVLQWPIVQSNRPLPRDISVLEYPSKHCYHSHFHHSHVHCSFLQYTGLAGPFLHHLLLQY